MPRPPRHEPSLYAAGRYGAWATCDCGWHSETWNCTAAAQFAWAMHLARQPRNAGGVLTLTA